MADAITAARMEARKRSLAEDNLQSQDQLFHDLVNARKQSGKSVAQVAECLGVSVDVVRALEEGRVEITLADLRQYAYAVEALVSYRVRPNYIRDLGVLTASLHTLDSAAHWIDFSSPAVPAWKSPQVGAITSRD